MHKTIHVQGRQGKRQKGKGKRDRERKRRERKLTRIIQGEVRGKKWMNRKERGREGEEA